MSKNIFGIHVPTITPMNDRFEVDEKMLRQFNNFLIECGVCCLVPTANNGELPNLNYEERKKVWKITVEVAFPTKTAVFPCITANSTKDCVELAQYAQSIGADGIMVAPPFYFRLNNEEICKHFLEIAGAIDIPIMIHNEPWIFKMDVTPDLMHSLNEDSGGKICLIKESTDNTQRVHEIIRLCGEKVTVVVAGGGTALESLLLGAKAWMTGMINFIPATCVKLYDLAVKNGNYAEAKKVYYNKILPVHSMLQEIKKPVQTVKYALEVLWQPVGPTRKPLYPLSESDKALVRKTIEEINKI